MTGGFGRAGVGLLLLSLTACYASNVVAVEQRIVRTEPVAWTWTPVTNAELVAGFYESTRIEGEAAASLRKAYYLFEAGGAYTGAALVDMGDSHAFQTLDGTWQLTAAGLVLDGAPPVALESAEEHLRIAGDGGVLVLQRRPIE
jgi:hypothetical protein